MTESPVQIDELLLSEIPGEGNGEEEIIIVSFALPQELVEVTK